MGQDYRGIGSQEPNGEVTAAQDELEGFRVMYNGVGGEINGKGLR